MALSQAEKLAEAGVQGIVASPLPRPPPRCGRPSAPSCVHGDGRVRPVLHSGLRRCRRSGLDERRACLRRRPTISRDRLASGDVSIARRIPARRGRLFEGLHLPVSSRRRTFERRDMPDRTTGRCRPFWWRCFASVRIRSDCAPAERSGAFRLRPRAHSAVLESLAL